MSDYEISPAIRERIAFLYGDLRAPEISGKLADTLTRFKEQSDAFSGSARLTERDSMLITYGDMVSEPGLPPVATLYDFLSAHLGKTISAVHLLPFYPYSSDDGFSVIDYRQVDPQLGTWDDIRKFRPHFRLMFDGVINHVSAQGRWFQEFLQGSTDYQGWFITVDGRPDLSRVVRPRALPLLTDFETPAGITSVWTTFSADQVDLNYHNPDVLLEVVDTLLFYVSQGAELIRLDAIAYLWKEIGTPCIHLPQTHAVLQLLRAILDEAAPQVKLISETNVPHQDNISYWGNGHDEAQLVYNFALPPLVLHTLRTGSAHALTAWARTLRLPSDQATFFNFLASHDGIGLNPARGILTDPEINALVEQVKMHGGLVSYKHNADGSQSPYELNINYFDALSDPAGSEPLALQIDRFMVAHAILLAFVGLPGLYFHSLFGSRGWPEGVRWTGQNRTINRQKLARAALERDLRDPAGLRQKVLTRFDVLLGARASSPAFDPYGRQFILEAGSDAVFALARTALDGRQVWCFHNVSAEPQQAVLPDHDQIMVDLITSQVWPSHVRSIELAPYQISWLRPEVKHDPNV